MAKKTILTGDSPMPIGKYEGVPMSEVPATYLVWMYEKRLTSGSVNDYVKANLEALKKEASTIIANRKYGDK